jgi:redox-sensitive bicupin YhaK (pirin superfamily)
MGIAPSYEQKTVPAATKRGALKVVASPQGEGDAVKIFADATLYSGLLDGAEQTALALNPERKAYVHLIRGELQVNGQALKGGDAALIQAESNLELTHGKDAEVLVFDLAA